GVAMNDEVLQSNTNNFLASIYFGKTAIGISFLDISTGEFLTSEGNTEYIDKLLQNFNPSEVLLAKDFKTRFKDSFGNAYNAYLLDDWVYTPDHAYERLTGRVKTNSLRGFGIEDLQTGIIASGAILYYLSETQHSRVSHIPSITRIIEDAYVWMDRFTIRNLELYSSQNYNSITLLDVIVK